MVQCMYAGKTVCRPRTDEREEVGGQEVESKEKDHLIYQMGIDWADHCVGKRWWRGRKKEEKVFVSETG